jgi:hypothetical protein
MQAEPRVGRGSGFNAPQRLEVKPTEQTEGTHLITSEGQGFQSCRLLTARLVARHRLATAFAVVYAESLWRGGR